MKDRIWKKLLCFFYVLFFHSLMPVSATIPVLNEHFIAAVYQPIGITSSAVKDQSFHPHETKGKVQIEKKMEQGGQKGEDEGAKASQAQKGMQSTGIKASQEEEDDTTFTADKLAEAAKELESLHFEETRTTKSTLEQAAKPSMETSVSLTKRKEEKSEGGLLQKDMTDDGNLRLFVSLSIAFGIILGLYTTYMVYQLKKEHKKSS